MRGCKSRLIIELTDPRREELLHRTRCTTQPAGIARRARAILLLAEHRCFAAVERLTGMQRRHLRKWARRFLKFGLEGLHDQQRPGRKPVFSPRRGDASGEDGLRTAGGAGPFAVAVGLS